MSTTWYTLSYRTREGGFIALHNLQKRAALEIETAQTGLGSHAFWLEPQPHHYHQLELDLRNGR